MILRRIRKEKKNITEENNPVEPIVSNDPPVENLAVNLMDLKWRRKIKKRIKESTKSRIKYFRFEEYSNIRNNERIRRTINNSL